MQRRTGVTPSGGGIRHAARFALVGAMTALIASCATTPDVPTLPPVSETKSGVTLPGKFVWGDLVSQDVEASKTFYGTLFGWTFEKNGRYTTILNRGERIAGIVQAADADRGTEWIGNLSVADVDRATAIVAERGLTVDVEPTDAPERGRIALVGTKKGAVTLLVTATGGDPPDADPQVGGWLWWELWSHEPEAAMDLLVEITGLERETVDLDGVSYRVLHDSTTRRFGIVHAPPDVHPTWLPFFRVNEIDASVQQAVALGARLVHQTERSAILVDPNRAEFAVGTWAKKSDRMRKVAE